MQRFFSGFSISVPATSLSEWVHTTSKILEFWREKKIPVEGTEHRNIPVPSASKVIPSLVILNFDTKIVQISLIGVVDY